jgi:hypothetical protein
MGGLLDSGYKKEVGKFLGREEKRKREIGVEEKGS